MVFLLHIVGVQGLELATSVQCARFWKEGRKESHHHEMRVCCGKTASLWGVRVGRPQQHHGFWMRSLPAAAGAVSQVSARR